ncbi:uncharacterized protein PSFLO_04778 [Pseudozyma flocculosa]|uniref:Uncharacterized protein n=1 Tax=Pseudozyma flocculosa TaxID=84751 RepID=A0A5C3F4B7_9BASI|nr:uncharacterized protein PSFLO_04778 [Pseudozyma flocculosa]
MQLSSLRAAIYPSLHRQSIAYRHRFVNMVKPDDEVIKEFNELVNMSADELEKWLKSKDSQESGWTGGGGGGGETVGHDSGNKITDILRRNPDKKKDKYTDEDLKHMRKVVSYNKRHLAQEEHLKESKSEEELKKTKSYKSLKTGATTSAAFRSDVAQPTALRTGKIGGGQAAASSAAVGAGDAALGPSGLMASQEYLDKLEEGVNKTIDGDIETLLESFKELISLATIGDKDKVQIEQEAFQADARADAMVRSAQNLSLLSESLKLSLLLSKAPDPALNDEAIELMKSTELEKVKCAQLLERILGLPAGGGATLVDELEDNDGIATSETAPGSGKGEGAAASQGTAQPPTAEQAARSHSPPAAAASTGQVGKDDDDGDALEMEDVSMG